MPGPIPDICSHDAPGQQPGTKCIRCGKLLPGEPPKEQEVKEEVKPLRFIRGK